MRRAVRPRALSISAWPIHLGFLVFRGFSGIGARLAPIKAIRSVPANSPSACLRVPREKRFSTVKHENRMRSSAAVQDFRHEGGCHLVAQHSLPCVTISRPDFAPINCSLASVVLPRTPLT